MRIKSFLGDLSIGNKFEKITTKFKDIKWKKYLENIFWGAALFENFKRDNDLADFLASRVTISEATLIFILTSFLENNPSIECDRVEIEEGYILCWLHIKKGPLDLQVVVKLGNIQVKLLRNDQKVKVDVLEFPEIIPCSLFCLIICPLVTLSHKILGSERIYRYMVKKIPGLAVENQTVNLDLVQVSVLQDMFSRKVLGVKVVEYFEINRVEMQKGNVRVYGGPKVPNNLLNLI
ncbi:MAG: hypothetical protein K9L17_01225 [Clostridiales bacterium]|nr:hypothetical protein [Clostridiales bacterium]MCF8021313.1 hypothetical protein [Clostridiales bacterium]